MGDAQARDVDHLIVDNRAVGEHILVHRKLIGSLSLACLVTTVIWLVLLIAGQASAGSLATFDQVLDYVGEQSGVFFATYANAALVTVVAIGLFAGLYVHLRSASPVWSAAAIVFVPVYGAMNLCVYLSQITIVPRVLDLYETVQHREASELLLRQLIQVWPDSAVFVVNNVGYAVLAVPSIIFGTLLFRSSMTLERVAGVLLALSGVASVAGLIGIASRAGWLSHGSLVGGVLFLLALVPVTWSFLSEPKREPAGR